jgi:hypothetical protein
MPFRINGAVPPMDSLIAGVIVQVSGNHGTFHQPAQDAIMEISRA